jgi:hypothetical protein
LTSFTAKENSGGSIDTSKSRLEKAGVKDVKDKTTYYNENFDKILSGNAETYE